MNSEANEECSLGLVFFDIIYLNSEPFHAQPYSRRPEILEDLICLVLSTTSGEANPIFVGNEGMVRVTAVGEGVHSLAVDDWFIMIKQEAGTWDRHHCRHNQSSGFAVSH